MSGHRVASSAILLVLCGLVARGAVANSVDSRAQEIFVVNAGGSGQRNLTKNHLADDHPTISRTGSLVYERDGGIATMSSRGDGRHLVVRIAGTRVERPVLSRDGTLVAFTSCVYSPDEECSVGVVGRDGTGLKWIQNAADPAWLLGRRLAFRADFGPGFREGPHTIAVANADGTDRRVVARSEDFAAYKLLPPTASPDGSTIAFAAYGGPWTLYSLDVSPGSTPHVLAPNGYDPVWSPDGRELVFSNNHGLWTVRADGTRLRPLHRVRSASFPRLASWSPDGQRIAYVNRPLAKINLVIMNRRTKTFTIVARDVVPRRPLWSRDGRRVYYVAERRD